MVLVATCVVIPVPHRTQNTAYNSHDHATGSPEVRIDRACHFVGWLARFNRRLSGARYRQSNQPGFLVDAISTRGDEPTGLVRYSSVQLCFFTDRPCLVIRYKVGIVPTLLGGLKLLINLSPTLFC